MAPKLSERKVDLETNPKDAVHPDVLKVKNHCRPMAEALAKEKDKELVVTAAESRDFRHRVAAAWALGLMLNHDEELLKLLMDESPFVRLAAREACMHVALCKYGSDVDFGPAGAAEDSELADSRALWELYFRKKEKDKAQRKLENKKETDPRKILGVE